MENPFEYIDSYVQGSLNPELTKRFEEIMQQDAKLRAAVAFERDVSTGIQHAFDQDLKQKLIHAEVKSIPTKFGKIRTLRNWTLAIAAAVLILLTFWWLLPTRDEPTNFFDQYYQPYPNVIQRVDRSTINDTINTAFILYEEMNYLDAMEQFDRIALDHPNSTYPRFYSAICLLELGQPRKALAQLNTLIPSKDPRFTASVNWYMALAQIKLGEIANARSILQNELQNKPEYEQRVSQLLADLR